MNTHHWPTARHIAELLADAPQDQFERPQGVTWFLGTTADGIDKPIWLPKTERANHILVRLRAAHEAAVDTALGYNWRDYTGGAQNAPGAIDKQKAWAALYASTPSASDALTAEFARRAEYLTWPDAAGSVVQVAA